MEKDAVTKAKAGGDDTAEKKFYFTLYGPSHLEIVREHLEPGVLQKMIKKLKIEC